MPDSPPQPEDPSEEALERGRAYWRLNLKVLALFMGIWFAVSFLAGIVFVDALNQFSLGGFPFGFWMVQQGSILVFVVLILAYALVMGRADRAFGVDEAKH